MTRKPVIMPAKPPDAVLKAMAGKSLLMYATYEAQARSMYLACRKALAKRKGGK